jgi:hypothetical protein
VVRVFADALEAQPDLRFIAVVPHFPDRDSTAYNAPQLYARAQALELLREAGGDRVAVYGIENHLGRPVYVHAKVCIVDDTWAIIGSDNFNRRSWTHDSELSCAVVDQPAADDGGMGVRRGAGTYAHSLRTALSREHLGGDAELDGACGAFEAFRRAAGSLARGRAAGAPATRAAARLPQAPAVLLDHGVGSARLPADLRPGRAPAVDAAGRPLLIWPAGSSPPQRGQSHQRNNGCAAVLTMRREVRHGRRLTRDHLAKGRLVVACRMPVRRPRTVLPGLRGRPVAGGDRRSEGGVRGLRGAP